MSSEPGSKPVPTPDGLTHRYWEAAAQRRLELQWCAGCDRYIHFPLPACPTCGTEQLGWKEVSGDGFIYSFVVVHHVVTPGFDPDVPYVVAWVELVEQAALRIVCNVLDADAGELAVDDRVEVCFEDRGGFTLPQCRRPEAV